MKDIKGYEGLYGITSCGKVWSYKSNRFLSLANNNGYMYVTLCKEGRTKQFRVHRLVAEAYLENPNNLPCVNHKDEVRSHNWIDNLEWCDYNYNNNYGQRKEKVSKTRSKRTKLQNQRDYGVKIRCVETGEIFDSQTQAAEKYGLDQGNISRVCRGKAKTTGGYHFEFVREEL